MNTSLNKRKSFAMQIPDGQVESTLPPVPMHKERLAKALAKIINRTRQDSVSMRAWDAVMMCAISLSFIRWTLAIIDNGNSLILSRESEGGVGLLLSAIYVMDVYIRLKVLHPRDRAHHGKSYHAFNVFTAFPWDVIVLAVPSWRYIVHVIGSIQATRILLLPSLFRSDSPDVVDVLYINFYYTFLPKIRILVFTALCLHTLTIVHVLCTDGDGVSSYNVSMLWVWTLITSAPLSVVTTNEYDTALAGLLMLMSMMVQGYFVSTVSTLLLGFNMHEQTRTHMLITLEMLRYYKVPRELQEEVLSFQYHVLQDSSMQTQFAPELERLPPTMLIEIDLYVKIGVLDKVAFFDAAPKECKRKMAMVMHQVMIDPMTAIITAGDVGTSMYFMLHGLADVTLPSGLIVATIRRGDFFGEMALINSDAKRTATVCALTFCDVLELTKTDFDKTIHEFPEFFEVVNTRRTARLEQSMRISDSNLARHVGDDDDKDDVVSDSDIDFTAVGGPLAGSWSDMRRHSSQTVTVKRNETTTPELPPPINPLSEIPATPLYPHDYQQPRSPSVSDILRRASEWSNHRRTVNFADSPKQSMHNISPTNVLLPPPVSNNMPPESVVSDQGALIQIRRISAGESRLNSVSSSSSSSSGGSRRARGQNTAYAAGVESSGIHPRTIEELILPDDPDKQQQQSYLWANNSTSTSLSGTRKESDVAVVMGLETHEVLRELKSQMGTLQSQMTTLLTRWEGSVRRESQTDHMTQSDSVFVAQQPT